MGIKRSDQSGNFFHLNSKSCERTYSDFSELEDATFNVVKYIAYIKINGMLRHSLATLEG